MEVQERNGVKIYSLNTGVTLPPWLGERARRNLNKRDANIRHRVDLIQDFDMPSSSIKMRQSNDGRYILVAGSYHPRVRVYDVDQLAMKFERYIDAEPIDIRFLSEDYGKFAVLSNDRSVAFHAPYGHHATIRIPTFGRALGYEPHSCDLLIPSSSGDVYRFNLEEGRFQQPFTGSAGGTCIAVSPAHPLSAVGSEDGIVRFYDNRASNEKPMQTLDIAKATDGMGFTDDDHQIINGLAGEVCSLAFDAAGLHFACGTKVGCVPLYDMRSSHPLHIKEHQNGLPIHTVEFHKGSNCVLSSDCKLIKLWRMAGNYEVGTIAANIESPVADFTHIMIAGDQLDPIGSNSGLLLCATDDPRMQAFYCPAIGTAPRWCSFLENITEELEEENLQPNQTLPGGTKVESVYDDYKFVTLEEVERLGITNLIGTKLLRGYMHGFFMDLGLYAKVRAVANPFEYDEYRKKKIKEKMEEKQASRIAPKKRKKTASVNAELVSRLEAKAAKGDKVGKTAKAMLEDSRFASLFENPDFYIDEKEEAFKLRNASGVSKKVVANQDNDMDSDRDDNEDDDDDGVESNFVTDGNRKRLSDDIESNILNDSNDSESESDDDDGFAGAKVRLFLLLHFRFMVSL
jgi:ribosome biogenesis protein ENP2